MKGRLITFEGIDGSGKSTQASLFFDWFRSLHLQAVLLREPGGTPLGEAIRSTLLDHAHDSMSPESELFLYLAARAELTHAVIRPSLSRGETVILDRFTDSTVAYQGYARGLGPERVSEMNLFATGGLIPDLTVCIDVDPSLGLSRLTGEPDRLESEGLAFMARVREGYRAIAATEPSRFIVLDGALAINDLQARIRTIAFERFPDLRG
jgi:dTMP kinase